MRMDKPTTSRLARTGASLDISAIPSGVASVLTPALFEEAEELAERKFQKWKAEQESKKV